MQILILLCLCRRGVHRRGTFLSNHPATPKSWTTDSGQCHCFIICKFLALQYLKFWEWTFDLMTIDFNRWIQSVHPEQVNFGFFACWSYTTQLSQPLSTTSYKDLVLEHRSVSNSWDAQHPNFRHFLYPIVLICFDPIIINILVHIDRIWSYIIVCPKVSRYFPAAWSILVLPHQSLQQALHKDFAGICDLQGLKTGGEDLL